MMINNMMALVVELKDPPAVSWMKIKLYERIQHLTSSILPAKSESLHQCEMDNKVER